VAVEPAVAMALYTTRAVLHGRGWRRVGNGEGEFSLIG
jgi:hypothetical protein